MTLLVSPPPPSLRHYIEALFLVDGISDDCVGVRLPKRATELVVALDGRYTVLRARRDVGETYDTAWFTGMCTTPVTLQTHGRSRMLGARFTPWGARAFVDVRQSMLVERSLRLEDAWGSDAVNALRAALLAAPDANAAFARLASELTARLPSGFTTPAPVVQACSLLLGALGQMPVREVALRVGISEQRLRLLFREHIGVSPKMLARLIAHDEALARLNDLPKGRLTGAAHALGFADQSHFIRDFSGLSGLTPGEYLALRGPPGSRGPFSHFLRLAPGD